MSPLFIKYRTKSNRRYIYDLGTGRILEVDEVIYAIVDDLGILTHEEMLAKYDGSFEGGSVPRALAELEEIKQSGYLRDHLPRELTPVSGISYGKNFYTLHDFWNLTASLLILGVTERCNLCCSYCTYSGGFASHRTHSDKTMSFEVAQKAIIDYMRDDFCEVGDYPISFYGGEPLLEIELLQRIMDFALEHAQSRGKTVSFSLTTNGTLLDDNIADTIVDREIITMVSLDGPKLSHDRNRVFRDGSGSFETVYGNLKRFAERYPGYEKRGINATLTSPIHLEETNTLVESLYAAYPLSRASLATPNDEQRAYLFPKSPIRYGCYTSSCGNTTTPDAATQRSLEEEQLRLMSLWDECVGAIKECGITGARKKVPLGMMLFEQQIESFHCRNVREEPLDFCAFEPCFPGFTRRFCDADGNYRVCERVDNSDVFKLGDVFGGLDPKRLRRVMELKRHFGDCGNCTSVQNCDICYARISNADDSQNGFDPFFDVQCQQKRATSKLQLVTYTEIMESNPKAFDKQLPTTPARLSTMRYTFSTDMFGRPHEEIL